MADVFHIYRSVREGRFLYLVLSLLFYILAAPWLRDFVRLSIVYNTAMTLILVAAVLAVSENRAQRLAGTCIALPTIAASWMAYATNHTSWEVVSGVLLILFLGYIIGFLLRFIVHARNVTSQVVFSAVSVYLIMGVFWSLLFALLEFLEPGSFKGLLPADSRQPMSFLYFSFVTLTTLGYGDITPATSRAESLAMTEAVIGQIFMTVLIAWLVGMNVSRAIEKKQKQDKSVRKDP
jgi:hypothetical protein